MTVVNFAPDFDAPVAGKVSTEDLTPAKARRLESATGVRKTPKDKVATEMAQLFYSRYKEIHGIQPPANFFAVRSSFQTFLKDYAIEDVRNLVEHLMGPCKGMLQDRRIEYWWFSGKGRQMWPVMFDSFVRTHDASDRDFDVMTGDDLLRASGQ